MIKEWLAKDNSNHIEFRWVPSHIGFPINKLADSAAGSKPVGPFPYPIETIASRIRRNHGLVISEWRPKWHKFISSKQLHLKKKQKPLLPNCWDGKGKIFITTANTIEMFSRFTRLISEHAPTGEYR